MNKEYPVTIYEKDILIEVPIQLCISDFLREGDCAFDAGANVGSLSVAMSRIVGPKGKIFSFEPNPFTLPRIKQDLDANGCSNVQIVPKAVWSESGKLLPFYCDDSYYAVSSRLLSTFANATQVEVETITLDDFCSEQKVIPDVIKLDVEGAEYQALQGATRTIKEHAPVILLEYYPSCPAEEDPVTYLGTLGYKLIDTNLYEQVQREYYHAHYSKTFIVNILAIPSEKWKGSPYESISLRHLVTIDNSNSKFNSNSPAPLSHQPVHLNPGRYMAVFDFDGPDTMTGLISVTSNKGYLIFYQATVNHLKTHACANMVFEIDEPQEIQCQLTNKTQGAFIFRSIQIMEICLGLNGYQSPRKKDRPILPLQQESPQISSQIQALETQLLEKETIIISIKSELARVYGSRRWRLATFLADKYWKMRRLLNFSWLKKPVKKR
jgi:FkbM family methyltransferase